MEKIEWSRVVPAGLAAALAYFYVDILVAGFAGIWRGFAPLLRPGNAAGPGGWGPSALGVLFTLLQFVIVMAGYAAVRRRFRGDAGAILAVGLAFWAFAALQGGLGTSWKFLIQGSCAYPLAVAAGSLVFKKTGRRLDL